MPTEYQLAAQRMAPVLPPVIAAGELPGRVVGAAKLRVWPEARPDTLVRELYHNAEVRIVELVQGEDGDPWYRLSDAIAPNKAPRGVSYFVHNSYVRVPDTDNHPTPMNPDRLPPKWLEADLRQPTLLTAYEAGQAVWSTLALNGRSPHPTPLGRHRILWRVANETMDSRTLPGIGDTYLLRNVLYTQYFTPDGAAIHYNYWSSNWGYAGSHGCLGLPLTESKWAWDWAATGLPVRVFSS